MSIMDAGPLEFVGSGPGFDLNPVRRHAKTENGTVTGDNNRDDRTYQAGEFIITGYASRKPDGSFNCWFVYQSETNEEFFGRTSRFPTLQRAWEAVAQEFAVHKLHLPAKLP